MCRLLYLSNEAIENIETRRLTNLLRALDLSNGGDGMGFGGLTQGKWSIYKYMNPSYSKIAKLIKSINWDNGVIVHTRRASMGAVSYQNIHPMNFGDFIIAMNGHWNAFQEIIPVFDFYFDEHISILTQKIPYVGKKGEIIFYETQIPNRSDTWAIGYLLKRKLPEVSDIDNLMEKFHYSFSQFGNFIIMFDNGDVYFSIGVWDFEYIEKPYFVAASEGISMIVGDADPMGASDGLLRWDGINLIEVIEFSELYIPDERYQRYQIDWDGWWKL